eukprot:CAMPEP_0113329428 /NCGR_PEP_ID=MMETSP0010_2-20120614/20902_1 /TAXON_ID=216773 ORGANISM="Corethron hystrix, Strain 308" /NCGR_SAMPLE_ID=MMETSP0010_2 /ASSEMBLY_ACC=CAM_ASM_000155 /LENGTH=886 /DNA_ID=CAMNT_0000191531 /DNA_START=49 /DNA_END=2709 /DNA_ORIENTATION=+ /assembly_acc=CAM_ASM_000155
MKISPLALLALSAACGDAFVSLPGPSLSSRPAFALSAARPAVTALRSVVDDVRTDSEEVAVPAAAEVEVPVAAAPVVEAPEAETATETSVEAAAVEEIASAAVEEIAPAAVEEIAPAAVEEIAPAAADTVEEEEEPAPVVVEEPAPVIATPVVAEEPTPVVAKEPSPIVPEEPIPSVSRTRKRDVVMRQLRKLPLVGGPSDVNIDAMAAAAADSLLDEACELDPNTGGPADEACEDESALRSASKSLASVIGRTLRSVSRGEASEEEVNGAAVEGGLVLDQGVFIGDDVDEEFLGELLEQGWEKRGNSSAIRRNAEVWKFALKSVFRVLRPRSMRKKGALEEEIAAAKVEAATFVRDGLLRLGPSFVKLGQVVSTRTDVLPAEYTDVLKTLQDNVPGFSGKRARDIVSKELGRPVDEIFSNFSEKPLAAASLGQVHTAKYKGKNVAIKVQRAGLKELFDVDLKNLRKLAELLDKFDPKTDGADRDWVNIYNESAKLLYKEIDYLNEADNAERFAKDFADTDYVRVPDVYREVSTPRVLTMEFVESFKLTDIKQVEQRGLNREKTAERVANAFLKQIIETGYFHCDPHPGNLCVDAKGNLVYYDFGMMDELRPKVRSGFRKFCTALFAGGPTVSDIDLAKNAKMLVDGVEEAGVLSRGADRLAVEKLARYFMRTFKDKQLGKKSGNIKETLGTDLQTLTENNSFRFPSTFTFIFRSFASIDGIGKGLDDSYDIGKLAQPFVEVFTESQKGYTSDFDKNFNIFSKATGLNQDDINTAITSPRKIAYVEETLRSMETGNLKIRVRSLENEKALERMVLTQARMENLLLGSILLNVAGLAARPLAAYASLIGAGGFLFKAFGANAGIKKFDKTQAKFQNNKFEGDEEREE